MKPKRKAKKRKAAKRATFATININLSPEHLGYIEEIASYACVTVDIVCAVMMGCGIFQARRYKPPEKEPEAPVAPEVPAAPPAEPEAQPAADVPVAT